MKRRSFLGGLAALFAAPAVSTESLIEEAQFEIKQHSVDIAFTPWTYVEEPVRVISSVPFDDFSELAARTIAARSADIARNVMQNNSLYLAMKVHRDAKFDT